VSPECAGAEKAGKTANTSTALAKAITPPSLFGIDRKIAYAKRKYHSGWICTGVTKGFAGIKFSGSPRSHGSNKLKNKIINNRKAKPSVSFTE
jgi:hypothetical protein